MSGGTLGLAPGRSNLRPGQSTSLGHARVLGDLNRTARRFELHRTGPGARNYCLKLVWSDTRRTAIYLGANHSQPHRLNDVWEFDLQAMAWKLLYAPDLPRDYKGLGTDASDVVYRDGLLSTLRGGPAIIGHTWWGLTYDPDRKQVLFMNAWPADVDAAIRRVGGDPALRNRHLPLWSFDPASGSWHHLRTLSPAPRAAFGGLLQHVPELGGTVWHMNNWQMRGTWLLERGDRWRNLGARGVEGQFSAQAPAAELVGYHDAGRSLLVARQGKATFELDLRRLLWRRIDDDPKGPEIPAGHAARTTFLHDRGSGCGVLYDRQNFSFWSYLPGRGSWRELRPEGPPPSASGRSLCWFDELAGVIIVGADTEMWAFKHPS